MIQGKITEQGIYFEIELVTSDGEEIPVDVLFDSGFTSGILAVHSQDITHKTHLYPINQEAVGCDLGLGSRILS